MRNPPSYFWRIESVPIVIQIGLRIEVLSREPIGVALPFRPGGIIDVAIGIILVMGEDGAVGGADQLGHVAVAIVAVGAGCGCGGRGRGLDGSYEASYPACSLKRLAQVKTPDVALRCGGAGGSRGLPDHVPAVIEEGLVGSEGPGAGAVRGDRLLDPPAHEVVCEGGGAVSLGRRLRGDRYETVLGVVGEALRCAVRSEGSHVAVIVIREVLLCAVASCDELVLVQLVCRIGEQAGD